MKQRSPKRVNDALTVSVAQKLKELRAACGFSQEYVKENTGVNLQRSESGKTTVSLITLDILCRFYGTTLKDFFAELDLKAPERVLLFLIILFSEGFTAVVFAERLHLGHLAVLGGSHALLLFEDAAKIFQVFESAFVSNLFDNPVRIGEQ